MEGQMHLASTCSSLDELLCFDLLAPLFLHQWRSAALEDANASFMFPSFLLRPSRPAEDVPTLLVLFSCLEELILNLSPPQ